VINTVGISQESLGDPLDLDFQTEQYKSYKRTKNLAIHEPIIQMVLQDNLMWFCPLLLLYQCMPLLEATSRKPEILPLRKRN
jgi:hypothetical protein